MGHIDGTIWARALAAATTPTLDGLLAVVAMVAIALLLRACLPSSRGPGAYVPGKRPGRAGADPRRGGMRKRRMFSDWEAAMLPTIAAQCPPGTHVCPQAHVRDFIGEADGTAYRWSDRFRKVAFLVVDFLIVDAAGRPLLVIELDDRTHAQARRTLRDRRLDETLREAGVRIMHVRPNTPIRIAPYLRRL